MKPRALEVVLVHVALFLASLAVLYPVLWVLRLALSPEGRLAPTGPLPIPDAVSLASPRARMNTAYDTAIAVQHNAHLPSKEAAIAWTEA